MKNNSNLKLGHCCLVLILISLLNCQKNVQKDEDCAKFKSENYLEVPGDKSLVRKTEMIQKIVLERFGENLVKNLNHEAYQLLFYSSHGFGKSVKFEKTASVYLMTVKCITERKLFYDCKEYRIKIAQEEWSELEKMIYEFNFWTEENFRDNKNVLDGFTYLLAGNRPQAEKCNKKTYKLVGRGSPTYDKIGALCSYILDYEEQLKFRYEQGHEIREKGVL